MNFALVYFIFSVTVLIIFFIILYKCINWLLKVKKGITLFNKGYSDEAIKILSDNLFYLQE